MRRNNMLKVVVVTVIVMVVSYAIAGIIGVQAGIFRDIATGKVPVTRPGGVRKVTIEVPAGELKRVTIVDSVSDFVGIYVAKVDSIVVYYHEPELVTTPIGEPSLKGTYQAGTAEIRLEWKRSTLAGKSINGAWLEVLLPRRYQQALTVDTISSRIGLGEVQQPFTDLTLSTVSGEVNTKAIRAKRVSVQTVSGDVTLPELLSEQNTITTVSGRIDIRRITGDADLHSTSGKVAAVFEKIPANVTAENISGSIRLTLPKDAGFTLEARTVSGDIDCTFPITLTNSRKASGQQHIAGTVGNGNSRISARTVSGDVTIHYTP